MPSTTSKTALARDAVAVDPKHYKVELENDRVRIVRITYGPHEKSVMHQHPVGAGIFLNDSNFMFTYSDGRSEHIEAKAGQFLWFGEPWEHLPENLDDKACEVLYVEVKS